MVPYFVFIVFSPFQDLVCGCVYSYSTDTSQGLTRVTLNFLSEYAKEGNVRGSRHRVSF